MPEKIEIFRAGRHVANSGERIDFSAADIAQIAASYDPDKFPAPIVVGHPALDAPAYGWAKGLSVEGDILYADPDRVEPQFAELVRDGRYRNISSAIYRPTDAGNPKPGGYYLRHIGFLGAHPPAIKGLKPALFAAADHFLTFGDVDGSALRRLLRRLRDSIVADKGIEAAEQVLPSDDIDALCPPDQPPELIDMPQFSEQQWRDREAEIARRESALKDRETAIQGQSAEFAERDKAARRAIDEAAIDSLIKDGKMLPALKPRFLAFMASIPAEGELSFAEPDGKTVKKAPRELFVELLGTASKVVTFGEAAKKGDEGKQFSSFVAAPGTRMARDRLDLHNRALAFAETNKIPYVEAVRRLESAA